MWKTEKDHLVKIKSLFSPFSKPCHRVRKAEEVDPSLSRGYMNIVILHVSTMRRLFISASPESFRLSSEQMIKLLATCPQFHRQTDQVTSLGVSSADTIPRDRSLWLKTPAVPSVSRFSRSTAINSASVSLLVGFDLNRIIGLKVYSTIPVTIRVTFRD
jgi:hypothetical protein